MPEFLTVLHIYHSSETEVDAIAEADDIKLGIEKHLIDTENGEAVDVVQVIPTSEDPTPTAQVTQLRRSRNILIRTRIKECWEFAKALDEIIFQLSKRTLGEGEYRHAGYDWSNFMTVTKEVLDGHNPLDH